MVVGCFKDEENKDIGGGYLTVYVQINPLIIIFEIIMLCGVWYIFFCCYFSPVFLLICVTKLIVSKPRRGGNCPVWAFVIIQPAML